MDFVRSHFGKMQLRIVEHFFLQKKVAVVLHRYLFVKKKVFNYSEVHFSEVTSYKIHTLAIGAAFRLKYYSKKTENKITAFIDLFGSSHYLLQVFLIFFLGATLRILVGCKKLILT